MTPETEFDLPWEGAEAPLEDFPIDNELVEKLLGKMSWLKGQEIAQKNAQKAQATRLQNRIAWVMFGIAPVLDRFIKTSIERAGQGRKTPVRSIPMSGGRIALRQVPEKFAVTAPDKLIAWAHKEDPENESGIRKVKLKEKEALDYLLATLSNEELLEMQLVTEVHDPEAVKQYVTSVGEIPDGVTYEPAHDISILDFGKGLGTFRVEGWVLTKEDEAGGDE